MSSEMETLPKLCDHRNSIFLAFFLNLMSKKLLGHFEQVYVLGLEKAQQVCQVHGAVFAPNHIAYWDSALFVLLSSKISPNAFVFMDADNLKQYSFLKWCGVLPLESKIPRVAIQQLQNLHHLHKQTTQFWIFPQGKQQPSHVRPLGFKKGVGILARSLDIPIIPMSIQYLYKDAYEKPFAYVCFHNPLPSDSKVRDIEEAVHQGLQSIDEHILYNRENLYQQMFPKTTTDSIDLPSRILTYIADLMMQRN